MVPVGVDLLYVKEGQRIRKGHEAVREMRVELIHGEKIVRF